MKVALPAPDGTSQTGRALDRGFLDRLTKNGLELLRIRLARVPQINLVMGSVECEPMCRHVLIVESSQGWGLCVVWPCVHNLE